MYILISFFILFVVYAGAVILCYKPTYGKQKKDGLVDVIFNIFMWGLAIFILAAILKCFFG